MRVHYSLEGLVDFLSAWNGIADGMMSKHRISSRHLQDIIDSTKTTFNGESLDITQGGMSSRTAEGVYVTLVKGIDFLVDYINHIKHKQLIGHICVKMLNDSLTEAFLDILLR